MIARPMTMNDLGQTIEYGIRMKNRTVYKMLGESKQMIAYAFRRAISSATSQCFVLDCNGVIRGFILLSAEPYWWTDPRSGARYVTDLAFFSSVKGGGKALLEKAIEWARSIPRVVEFTSQHSSGLHLETVDDVYRGVGMQKLGNAFWITLEKAA